MENVIFLAFADHPDNPLLFLREEDDHIFRLLTDRRKKGHFSVFRESHTTRQKLIDDLGDYKNQIMVFHYSGHAGRDQLLLEDDSVNADGVASFLAQCPNLRLVILNGCSTKGQVDKLIELKPELVVISTSSPVNDRAASIFSKSFYKAFCRPYKSIRNAFEEGVAAAEMVSGSKIIKRRDVFREKNISSLTPVWDISSKSPSSLDWKLPRKIVNNHKLENFEPNSILTREILKAFTPINKKLEKFLKTESIEIEEKRWEILKVLPLPISEELRKLFAVPVLRKIKDKEENIGFFDTLNGARLEQLVNTYKILAELFGFIHLAQLWHICSEEKKLIFEKEQLEEVRNFFHLKSENRKKINWFLLIQIINKVFDANNIQNFLVEFKNVLPLLEEDSPFKEAINYFQEINERFINNTLHNEQEIIEHCVIAEEELAIIFNHLAFIINYRMKSVKAIGIFKYRHSKHAIYSHDVTKLRQKTRNIEEEKEDRFDPLNTASVFLINKKKKYLNLTPFIIDQNAFNPSARLAKIYHFFVYEEEIGKYAFKHVYNPKDNYFDVKSDVDHDLQMIPDQFVDFKKTVLKF